MNARWSLGGVALLCVLGLIASCRFEPDLSRFDECGEDGSCAQGFTCLAEVRRCLPDCGAQGTCLPEAPPDGSVDAGPIGDGGTDGGTPGGSDAGVPLSLVTEALALAVENVPYTMELQAQGGTPPYQFRATSSLPQGLMLDAGVLSGTPSTPGTFPISVEVSDSDTPPAQSDAGYDLRVRPQLLVAGPKTLVNGYKGEFYTEKVSAIGGAPTYTFAVVSGTVPPGLGLFPDGSITGTPTANGLYNFQVQATDSDPQQPQTATLDLSVTISDSPLFLKISTQSVPDGRVGTAYQYTLRTAPGAPDSWTLMTGSFPRGVAFDPDTAVISGTPLPGERGSFGFTVKASSGLLGNDTRSFSMQVH